MSSSGLVVLVSFAAATLALAPACKRALLERERSVVPAPALTVRAAEIDRPAANTAGAAGAADAAASDVDARATAGPREAPVEDGVPLPASGRVPIRDRLVTVPVPGDRPVLAVLGADTGRPILYLHGMCAEARPDLVAWGGGVSELGTILALQGNATCAGGRREGGASWTTDVSAIDARVDAAIDAARSALAVRLEPERLVLVGESMGAARAEAMAARFPSKYRRLVLVGAPGTPSPRSLQHAEAVALLAGEKEWQAPMIDGASGLAARGLVARFWQLPGATHGAYGPDGDRVMRDAVGFVTQERP